MRPDKRALALLAQAACQGAEAMQTKGRARVDAWRDAALLARAAELACQKAVRQALKEGCDGDTEANLGMAAEDARARGAAPKGRG